VVNEGQSRYCVTVYVESSEDARIVNILYMIIAPFGFCLHISHPTASHHPSQSLLFTHSLTQSINHSRTHFIHWHYSWVTIAVMSHLGPLVVSVVTHSLTASLTHCITRSLHHSLHHSSLHHSLTHSLTHAGIQSRLRHASATRHSTRQQIEVPYE
jgi:hypothetical protein